MLLGPILGFHQQLANKRIIFSIFATSVFLFALADGIFSYQVPLWLFSIVHDFALVGIVISSSSLIGFICDLVFPKILRGRKYQFFALATFIVAGFTQITALLLHNWLGGFVAMALWGVYYELFLFGLYHFLHTEIEPAQHASGWGVTEALRSLGLIIAPVFVGLLLVYPVSPFVFSGIFFVIAGILNFFLLRRERRLSKIIVQKKQPEFAVATFRVWITFLSRIWPVYIFFFSVILLDAAIWTAGIFFSEHLREQSLIGSLYVPAYYAPVLVAPLFAGKLARKFGKKHTAFVAAFPLGLLLLIGNWIERSAIWHVGTMLLAGSATALIVTESEAIFEDYVARLHRFSGEMVGLVRSASNIGYIVGPLCAGFAADWLGSSRTIAVIGLLPAIAAAIALLKFPGKTKLPQKALEEMVV